MMVNIYKDDLPADIDLGKTVAIDTETMGLKTHRDRLCLVQLSSGDGNAHLVQIANPIQPNPVLAALLANPEVTKLFHFARFDLAALMHYVGPVKGNIYCTKIASKLVRTYTDRHGLKELCRELLQIDISKQQQSSDWGADTLTSDQQNYAAGDVLYLHAIRDKLSLMLERENRMTQAKACFDFLPMRAKLDLVGFDEVDIFHH